MLFCLTVDFWFYDAFIINYCTINFVSSFDLVLLRHGAKDPANLYCSYSNMSSLNKARTKGRISSVVCDYLPTITQQSPYLLNQILKTCRSSGLDQAFECRAYLASISSLLYVGFNIVALTLAVEIERSQLLFFFFEGGVCYQIADFPGKSFKSFVLLREIEILKTLSLQGYVKIPLPQDALQGSPLFVEVPSCDKTVGFLHDYILTKT